MYVYKYIINIRMLTVLYSLGFPSFKKEHIGEQVSHLGDEWYKLTFIALLWIITCTKVIPALQYDYYN